MTIEQFHQIYNDWKQSGLSVQQYCKVCSTKNASGKAMCEFEYPTLNSLKILQESSKIPELTPRILENPPKFLKYLPNIKSILTIRGLLMAYYLSAEQCFQ